jgi:uncharacterized protein
MHPDIERLAEVQAVDTRLNRLRAQLAAFPKQLAEIEKHSTEARQQLTTAKEALTTSLKERKKYELDIESWKEKARKYRDQGSAVKTNEAYKALQHEIQHAEEETAQAEDRLLERMMAGEEFDRQVKAAERALAEADKATEGDRKKIQAEYKAVEHELQAKQAERQEKVAAVPADLFETYERIALRRHGVGLSEVKDEACSQCGVRIIPHMFQELRRADCRDIFHCETCTRILYYIEPPEPPAADANSAAAGAPTGKS